MNIEKLDRDNLIYICSFLSIKDFVHFTGCSKNLAKLRDEEKIWVLKSLKHYPTPVFPGAWKNFYLYRRLYKKYLKLEKELEYAEDYLKETRAVKCQICLQWDHSDCIYLCMDCDAHICSECQSECYCKYNFCAECIGQHECEDQTTGDNSDSDL